jgi:hypothetical protein
MIANKKFKKMKKLRREKNEKSEKIGGSEDQYGLRESFESG